MTKPVSIILLSRNRWPMLRRCLETLKKRTPSGRYELLAFDNASKDGTLEGLRRLSTAWPELRVFHNAENLPFAAAVNKGMRASRGSHFLWLNDDVTVTAGWLDGLLAACRSRGVSAAGPMTGWMAPPEQLCAPFKSRPSGRIASADFLGGFCFLVKRAAVESVGLLDERFVWGWEDMDYCLRLRHAGGRLALAKDVFVQHAGSQTIRTLPADVRRRDDFANRTLIARKWAKTEPWGDDLRRLFDEIPAPWHSHKPPKASILYLGRGGPRAAESLRRLGAGVSFEILSADAAARGFSLSRALNKLALKAQGEFLAALDDLRGVETGWLERLMSQLPSVDGLVLSGAGPATGLTLLLPKAAFERVGFFDERLNGALAVADYGLRARQLGLRVAVTGKPRYGSANETDFSALRKKWMGNKLFDVEFGPRPPIETIVLRQRAKGPWSRRLNAALKRSPAEHFLVVSEGVRPTRRLVDGLLKAARLESNIGVVGPRSRGTRLAWQDAPRKGPLRGGAYIRSFCFLIPRRMFEAIGPFDERFRGPLALADFCLRSHQRGFQVVVAGDVYLRSPRAGVDPHRVRDFPLFFEKWSGNRIFETELVA